MIAKLNRMLGRLPWIVRALDWLSTKFGHSSMPDNRPIRMWRRGREIDPEFEPSEPLYSRCTKDQLEDWDGNFTDVFSSLSVRFPDFSVNRGKYSEPEDVLIPSVGQPPDIYAQMGIVKFTVGTARWEHQPKASPIKYEMRVEHNPDDHNYSHSEVKTYKDGKYDNGADISKTIKKAYRARLARGAEIVRRPSI
jgi:hypothetical protein